MIRFAGIFCQDTGSESGEPPGASVSGVRSRRAFICLAAGLGLVGGGGGGKEDGSGRGCDHAPPSTFYSGATTLRVRSPWGVGAVA